jgi:hypothetical protein
MIVIAFLFLFLLSCSTQENEPCENKHGYLYKDGMELACPFTIQERNASRTWIDFGGEVAVLDPDESPRGKWNSRYVYRVKMNGLKKDFTEEQYTVSIQAVDKNRKPCGESREFIFYKVAEKAESVEYNTSMNIEHETFDIDYEKYLFFVKTETPSRDQNTFIDWGFLGGETVYYYHAIKICDGSFYLKGEIVNE